MPPLYLTEQGAKLHIDNRRAVATITDRATGADRELANVPLIHVSEVVIFGNVSLTTPAMKSLLKDNIDVVFLTLDGQYCGRLVGPATPHVLLRRKQYRAHADAAFALKLAQQLVTAKLQHLRVLLQRHNRERTDEMIAGAIDAIYLQLERVPRTTTIPALTGTEGAATAAYFGGLRRLISPDWQFTKRLRRPPPDPINVLLSFGYTLLAHAAEGAVAATGLDPYAGFLHTVDYNRPSLALDVMEEFRPLVDGVVLWCVNGGQITPADFTPGTDPDRPVVMSDRARRRFIEAYERRLAETFTHPKLNQKLSIRQCLLAQARQVAEAVQADRPEYLPMGFRQVRRGMRYVIAYDVSDDRRRARVAKRLEAVADRVQGSVFEADLNDKALARLLDQLDKAIDVETDGVRVYRLCGDCAGVVKIIGQSKVVKPPALVIVV